MLFLSGTDGIDSYDINITGTAARITGDFSNATVNNRTMFQSSTANGVTSIAYIPNGTATDTYQVLYSGTDTTNTNGFLFRSASTESQLNSFKAGTGTYVPITFYTGGTERIRITANGDTRPYYTNANTVASGATFTYNPATFQGQICLVTVSGAGTITFGAPSNITEGAPYTLILKAGDTSARTFAWNAAFKFPAATASLTSGTITSGAFDMINFIGGASNILIYNGHQADLR
jgi:hypothetical protein